MSRQEFVDPERFVVGTVGQPGERTFFVQVVSGNRRVSISLEKSQVVAICERLTSMNREIRKAHPLVPLIPVRPDDRPLDTPIEEEFRVGVIGLAWDTSRERIQIDLQEISKDESSIDEEFDESLSQVRILISLSVASAFVTRASAVVSAGRAPCPFCGGPINIDGHLCPRANGYRR